jgi:dinuclear metal center YbgI/SA1388 family protein
VVHLTQLDDYLQQLLQPELYSDYAPNGLQIAGKEEIERVVVGVSANEALIDAALDWEADAIFVHHGFFWKGEPRTITGYRGRRVKSLIKADVSLFGYHLPLDAHSIYGNNVQLLNLLDASPARGLGPEDPAIGWIGERPEPLARDTAIERLTKKLGQEPYLFPHGRNEIETIAVVTGGGAKWFDHAIDQGIDLFISGEPSEQSQGIARERNANFAAFGHHATERLGPMAIGKHLTERFPLETKFIDVPNPV